MVERVYQLDAGALLNDFFNGLQVPGVGKWLGDIKGTAGQREMVPVVQRILLYSLKTVYGIKSRPALLAIFMQ
jgi:hypothetical protein